MHFFDQDWTSRGHTPALIDEQNQIITYSDLAAQIETRLSELGGKRQLVFLEADNSTESAITILSCLAGGHPIIIGSQAAHGRIVDTFNPNIVISPSDGLSKVSRHKVDIHPDLAVMLSTSGSTGATKLVRLSGAAIHANAAAIAEYLNIGQDDRALTTLPISYSYGLSVLTSHICAGAAVVMTNRSVVDDDLWTLFAETEATSIAGVPYTYELLEATNFRDRMPGTLRIMTQAGGRLPAELVQTYHTWSRKQGVSFYTMYGQTEATARMAYLSPQEMDEHPDCIGRAIPGGQIHLIDEDGQATALGEKGELVYTGPNVMMGYATSIDDLARGSELAELRTGDLAQEVEDGLFRIVGRVSRFSKIAGLRISLDEIEQILAAKVIKAVVAGNDTLVAIAIHDPAQVAAAQRLIDDQTSIPLRSRIVFPLVDVPRLISGKIDYPGVLRSGETAMAIAEQASGQTDGTSGLSQIYARALNRRSVSDEDSFMSLAGDSLAYIEVSMAIELRLGMLPDHWEQLTIGQLETMATARPDRPSKLFSRSTSTEILIRPFAMTLIITGHIVDQNGGTGAVWKGGALALLMTAGYNATRFQREKLISQNRYQLISNFFWRFLLLYYLLIATKSAFPGEPPIHWSTLTLLNSYFPSTTSSNFDRYWFMEALFHLLVLTVILFSIPAVRNFAVKYRWWFALTTLGVATAFKFGAPYILSEEANLLPHRLDGWAYAFALGFCVADANNPARKLFCVGAAIVLAGFDWGFLDLHTAMLAGSVALILYVPRVMLWAPLATAAAFFAQSTFYIYLTHGFTNRLASKAHIYQPALIVAAAVIVGMIGYVVWRQVEHYIVRLWHSSDRILAVRSGFRTRSAEA